MKALCGEPNCDCGYTIDKLVEALENTGQKDSLKHWHQYGCRGYSIPKVTECHLRCQQALAAIKLVKEKV